jgi:hypothetical protein
MVPHEGAPHISAQLGLVCETVFDAQWVQYLSVLKASSPTELLQTSHRRWSMQIDQHET